MSVKAPFRTQALRLARVLPGVLVWAPVQEGASQRATNGSPVPSHPHPPPRRAYGERARRRRGICVEGLRCGALPYGRTSGGGATRQGYTLGGNDNTRQGARPAATPTAFPFHQGEAVFLSCALCGAFRHGLPVIPSAQETRSQGALCAFPSSVERALLPPLRGAAGGLRGSGPPAFVCRLAGGRAGVLP